MTASLIVSALLFAALHLGLPPSGLRPALIGKLGENGYRGLFSLGAAASLVWLVMSFNGADYQSLWERTAIFRWLAIALMPVALTLLAGSMVPANPTTAKAGAPGLDPAHSGVFAITRHPMMWGIGLWAVLHILANGDLAGIVLFGTLLAVALIGTLAIDARKRRTDAERWAELERTTSNLPFLALIEGRARLDLRGLIRPLVIGLVLWAGLLHAHGWLFGLSVIQP